MMNSIISQLKFDDKGLIPAIAQDYATGRILMQAYMNAESLTATIETGKATYFSRSRQCLWVKGETSGHFQHVKEILVDCDADCLLLSIEQVGPACHTGNDSCFYRMISYDGLSEIKAGTADAGILGQVYNVVADRRDNPKEGSYTNYLFDKGIDIILKKVGEETAEIIIGAKNADKAEISYEVADLMYHLTVMLCERGLEWSDVYAELAKRYK